MIVLDTTILVYAVGADHPLRDGCRRIVQAIVDARVRATTTPEVIEEFGHVRARRRPREDAVARARSYATLLSPLAVVGREELDAGLGLFAANPALGAFDAVLAAVTIAVGADAIVSADTAFESIDGLRWIAPDSDELDSLLGS